MIHPSPIIALLLIGLGIGVVGCDRNSDFDDFEEREDQRKAEDPRPPPEHLEVVDSFEIGGFTYGIDSVERSDVHAKFEDEKTGELDWVTVHYRIVNTSDKAIAPVVPDVVVETMGLRLRDTGGNAQIGEQAVEESGVSIGQLDKLQPGETELNMAIFKIPDEGAGEIVTTFDFDGYSIPTGQPLEYVFTLQPKPGTQVLAEPTVEPDAGTTGDGGTAAQPGPDPDAGGPDEN